MTTSNTFWLIELPSESRPLYLTHGDVHTGGKLFDGWTRNAMQAFQWATKAGAQAVLDISTKLPQGVQKHEVIVSEHGRL